MNRNDWAVVLIIAFQAAVGVVLNADNVHLPAEVLLALGALNAAAGAVLNRLETLGHHSYVPLGQS